MQPSPANPTYKLHPTAAAREVAGEVFVVTDDRGLHRLEVPTAVTIFRALMAGVCDRNSLLDRVVAEFEVEREVAARDLDEFVEVLIERRIAVQYQQDTAEQTIAPGSTTETATPTATARAK
jgi:hypothetical protein